MGDPASPDAPRTNRQPDGRLDSWKEIAAYLSRDVTTVQRWEKREAMPVHRHVHDKKGSVYAFQAELDAWARSRNLPIAGEGVAVEEPEPAIDPWPSQLPPMASRRRGRSPVVWSLTAGGLLLALAATWW